MSFLLLSHFWDFLQSTQCSQTFLPNYSDYNILAISFLFFYFHPIFNVVFFVFCFIIFYSRSNNLFNTSTYLFPIVIHLCSYIFFFGFTHSYFFHFLLLDGLFLLDLIDFLLLDLLLFATTDEPLGDSFGKPLGDSFGDSLDDSFGDSLDDSSSRFHSL